MKTLIFAVSIMFFLNFGLVFAETEKTSLNEKYYIEISISQCRLWVYKTNGNEEKELVGEYIVATVKRGLIHPQGKGQITNIEFNPWWFPTELSREEFRKRGIELAKAIPPGHKNNYMGEFKMHLSHRTSRGDIYRIHGNNDVSKIGTRATSGCVRMKNDEGVTLAKIIPVGTVVNIIN